MAINQRSYVSDVNGEVAAGKALGQPVIPTQRGTSPNLLTAFGRGEHKPILSPWMRNRAEFVDKVSELSK